MAVRSGMEYIIEFVRDLIGDPTGPTQKFTDQQIQDRLDLQRKTLTMVSLCGTRSLSPTGEWEYKHFTSGWTFWEASAVIQNRGTGEVIVPDHPNWLSGEFEFDTSRPENMVISGRAYNVYAVGVTLITSWMNDFKTQIQSWTADGTTLQRLNSIRSMQLSLESLSKMAWGWGGGGSQVRLVRRDIRN